MRVVDDRHPGGPGSRAVQQIMHADDLVPDDARTMLATVYT